MGLRFLPAPEGDGEEFEPKRFLRALDYTYEVESWKPIPVRNFEFERVYFVDGVRYTDARTLLVEDGGFAPLGEGIFISMGAGVCKVERNRLGRYDYEILYPSVGRFFIHNAKGINLPAEYRFAYGNGEVVYKTVETENVAAGASLLLRELEKEVVKKLWKGGFDGFTLMDGTVKTRRFIPFAAHIVKRSNNLYLDGEYLAVLMGLRPGERTPAFVFEEPTDPKTPEGAKQPLKKVAVYARLPGWGANPLEDVVRLELPLDERAEPGEVVKTLERAASLALRFANHPLRDRRSPQNLTAIAFLERYLRPYLGKKKLLRSLIYAALGVR